MDIESDYVKDAYNEYLELRKTLHAGKNKPMTLMDLATIGAKALKKKGLLSALDESEEINACSVKIKVDIDGKEEEWLLQFKNETHNHPTEIEPFGGAAPVWAVQSVTAVRQSLHLSGNARHRCRRPADPI